MMHRTDPRVAPPDSSLFVGGRDLYVGSRVARQPSATRVPRPAVTRTRVRGRYTGTTHNHAGTHDTPSPYTLSPPVRVMTT